MDFKAAAREVLGEVGHPLHYVDITEVTYNKVLLEFSATVRKDREPVVEWEMGQ